MCAEIPHYVSGKLLKEKDGKAEIMCPCNQPSDRPAAVISNSDSSSQIGCSVTDQRGN